MKSPKDWRKRHYSGVYQTREEGKAVVAGQLRTKRRRVIARVLQREPEIRFNDLDAIAAERQNSSIQVR
jgi:hypothetical protein